MWSCLVCTNPCVVQSLSLMLTPKVQVGFLFLRKNNTFPSMYVGLSSPEIYSFKYPHYSPVMYTLYVTFFLNLNKR